MSEMTFAMAWERVRRRLWLVLTAPLVAGLLALGITFLLPPTYVAETVFMPPQQSQSSGAAALASLGALSALAGAGGALRTPADQYVSLMQSATVSNRIIEQFGLVKIYDVELLTDARKVLAKKARFLVGKKDGLITIEVEDRVPQRAADMANRYVEELRRLTATLAVTEAQQRRVFFERHLDLTRQRLAEAQRALQASGFSQGALNSEPKSAAEGYARLRAQLQAAEVRSQALRDGLADDTPEVRQQMALIAALRAQVAQLESANRGSGPGDYVSRYRDYKYQETLFELYARQFELARVDESREGSLIQVVDPASPPERRSWPRRAATAVVTTLLSGLLLVAFLAFGGTPGRSSGTAARTEASA